MTQVSFYNKPPLDVKVASSLINHEIIVFNHLTSCARILEDQVTALVDFPVNTHNENTVPKWNGEDYFVMVRSDLPISNSAQYFAPSLRTGSPGDALIKPRKFERVHFL